MGITGKLIFFFIIVIMFMMLGWTCSSSLTEYVQTRLTADRKIGITARKMAEDFKVVMSMCKRLAGQLVADSGFKSAALKKNPSSVSDEMNKVLGQERFTGIGCLLDKSGKIIYSTEPPSPGFNALSFQSFRNCIRDGEIFCNFTDFNFSPGMSIACLVPMTDPSGNIACVLGVIQPLNMEFLTGEMTKLSLDEADPITNMDVLLISSKANRIVSITPSLVRTGGTFIPDLSRNGIKAIPGSIYGIFAPLLKPFLPVDVARASNSFEKDNRWWYQSKFTEKDTGQEYARLLLSTPLNESPAKIIGALLVAIVFGGIAIILSFIFTIAVGQQVKKPLRFLISRTKDIANRKAIIAPLDRVDGEYLELGELIDTAVTTMRSTTQNLKSKMHDQKEELAEKNKQVEESTQKLESLSKQISTQTRQIAEVSKQINQANRQAVILQHKLDAVLQSSTEGFLIIDQFGNVLSANPVFLNWIGLSEGQTSGKLCFDLVRRPGANKLNLASVSFARSTDPEIVLNNFHPEGVIFHASQDKKVEVLTHLQPITGEDNQIQGYVMVLRDKSLRSENAQLRQEMVGMLKDAIRAPLATGESRWSNILAQSSGNANPQIVQALADLHSNYQNLLGVVDSYLMMYGGIVPEPVAPRDSIVISRLVSDCLEEVSSFAQQRQLMLDYKAATGLPAVSTNKEAVKSVLTNSLSRLIDATAPGGRVRVESSIRNKEMRLSVTSSGPGLPEEEITDMFAGFIEGKHSQDTYSQRLSMYLARNNVERLGGKIWAESEAGRGIGIYFTLPVHTA